MALDVNLDLVRKYNKPGPRYTSYPTAPYFTNEVTEANWQEAIRENNLTAQRDLSLYFHIPFCDTLCYFCGCTMMVTRDRDKIEHYLTHIFKEMEIVAQMLNPDRKVVQLAFGGGTPTYLTPGQISRLGEKIHSLFSFSEDAEIGCEMDPRELTREHILALKGMGVNRASIGVQDFDPKVQKAVNRINPEEMIRQVIGWIHEEGFVSLNLDLIYGLPHQTAKSFEKTLHKIIELNPDRLAVFNYAHVPWMKKHQKLIKEEDLPSPDQKLDMMKMITETLTRSGYVYIGMDHFAKADDDLAVSQRSKTLQRNFQGYSTKAGVDIYSFGMSSISQLDTIYAQNTKDLRKYYKAVNEGLLPLEKGYIMTEEDKLRQTVIMRLMCDLELDFSEISGLTGVDFQQHFAGELSNMGEFVEDGLLTLNSRKLKVTETGRLFIRNIAMCFDEYIDSGKGRYSKTI